MDTYQTGALYPCFVYRHVFLVTGLTYLVVLLDEKITTFPVSIGVRCLAY